MQEIGGPFLGFPSRERTSEAWIKSCTREREKMMSVSVDESQKLESRAPDASDGCRQMWADT